MDKMMNKVMRLAACMSVLAVLMPLSGFAEDAETEPVADTVILEKQPSMSLLIEGYELRIDGVLPGCIAIGEQKEDDAQNAHAVFEVSIKGQTIPAYTLTLDSEEGDIKAVLMNEAGDILPISFQMMEVPEGLTQEDEAVFLEAQNTVNFICGALKLVSMPAADGSDGAEEAVQELCYDVGGYRVRISCVLAESVSAELAADGETLEFFVNLNEGKLKIYSLAVGSDIGDIIVMINDMNGNPVPAAFAMEMPSDELGEEEMNAFWIAQETVNDVIPALEIE